MSGSPALPSPQEYLKAKDTRKADTDEVRQLITPDFPCHALWKDERYRSDPARSTRH